MRKLSGLIVLATLVPMLTSGCGKKNDNGGGAGPGAQTAIGRPNPAFAGEAPKGAMKIEDMEVGKYGGRLVLAMPGNPKTFNPMLSNDVPSMDIASLLFATCYDYHRLKQEDEPSLCEKYERSADGLTYTFTLREGLRWSDGTPLTTDDFAFSYGVIIDPKIAMSVKDLFKQGTHPDGKPIFPTFEKVDDRVFRFKLTHPDVLFHVNVGSIYVVPKHKWQASYEAGEFSKTMTIQVDPKDLVGSGPFVLRDFKDAESVVFERNPNYWKVDRDGNRLPYLDSLMFLIVPDFNATLLRFREGKTDMLTVRPEDFDALKRREAKADYVVKDLGPSFSTNYIMFNLDARSGKDGKPFVDPMKQKWFQNKNFRKAISHAIDRDGIVRTVLNGRGQPLWSFYSPANVKWSASDKVIKYAYDLNKARAMLKSERYETRDGVLFDPEGNKVEFVMITNSENSTRIAMLNVIQEDLRKLGITAHIRPVPFNDVVSSLSDLRNFDAVLLGWGSAIPPDPAQSKNVVLSSGRNHGWNPAQPAPATEWEARMDTLLYSNIGAFDYAERAKYNDELQVLFSDWQPQIQLVVANAAFAGRKNLGNFKPAGLRPELFWNAESLYFKTPKER